MNKNKKNNIFPHESFVCAGAELPVKWESLSYKKRSELSQKMMEKVSENLSRYINSHPKEIESLYE